MKKVATGRLIPRPRFWEHVVDREGSSRFMVSRTMLAAGLFAFLVWFIDWVTGVEINLGIAVAPYEFAGAILGSLLVLRANSGLDRWWEARKLWGGITNQSRNLAVIAIANGPDDLAWRRQFVGAIISFAHVTRRCLRSERATTQELAAMIGPEAASRISEALHPPTAISLMIARQIRDARDRANFDPVAYLGAENQRVGLIDHLGGCERILKTPLATAYVVLIRRFIVLFLMILPFALLRRVEWLTPLVTLLVAYPILALDQIADDLQHPFFTRSINHLPLDEITSTIEANLLALLSESSDLSANQTGQAVDASGTS